MKGNAAKCGKRRLEDAAPARPSSSAFDLSGQGRFSEKARAASCLLCRVATDCCCSIEVKLKYSLV